MAPQDNKPKPVTTLRCSSIKASIWKNEGVKGPFYNVTVARAYKASDGTVKDAESFGLADLDALVVAQQAKVWVTERSGR
ncbi:MAG: hypothetical protein P0120_00650 [Nitrospira sp.]|nr:hypothetical protein [Nitrospira sp.]